MAEMVFISALAPFGGNYTATNHIYRTKLIEIYVKHGGDVNISPLVMIVALMQDYDGVHNLVEAAANI
ncbi:hypothetical protein N5853_01045 [Bartonella sp. HY329]|uniref:hypothetical protein n=1 Tax=unclassified Bartonella TaxID=2645622 RepID=UPI0021C76437|nr:MULTISPECIES: hypothetical protein [unclassified Bartonella]UXM95274.1 hypothetical protein N5853_01045 [Bartonella sp. HY329]UXN09598.1 hypothetical protein N5852_01050 [Bartonella sp. HY328]